MASLSNYQGYQEMFSATSLTYPPQRLLPRFDPASMNVFPSSEPAQSVSSPQQQTTEEAIPGKKRGRGTTDKPRGRPLGSKNKPKSPDDGLPKKRKRKGRPLGSKNKNPKGAHNSKNKNPKRTHNAYVPGPDNNLDSLGSQSQQTPMSPVAATKLVTPPSTPAASMKPVTMGYLPPTTSPYTDVDHHQHLDFGKASQYPTPPQSDNVSGNGNCGASNIFPPSDPNHTFGDGTFNSANNDSTPPVTTEDKHLDVSAQTTTPEYDASDLLSGADDSPTAYEQGSIPIDPALSNEEVENKLWEPPATTEKHDDNSLRGVMPRWERFHKAWESNWANYGIRV